MRDIVVRPHSLRRSPDIAMNPSRDSVTDALRSSTLFGALPAQAIDGIADTMWIREVRPQESAQRVHGADGGVFVVVSGRLKHVLVNWEPEGESGRGVIVDIAGVAGTFGGSIHPTNTHKRLIAVALVQSSVAMLDSRRFHQAVDENPVLARRLADERAHHLSHVYERLDAFARAGAETRLRMFISELANRFGSPHGRGTAVEHHLSHREIAEYVGVSRETISRLMAKLADGDHLDFEPRRLTLLDGAGFNNGDGEEPTNQLTDRAPEL